MKRVIKIYLTIFLVLPIFLALPENKYLLKVEAAGTKVSIYEAIEEIILRTEEYLKDLSADDLMLEKKDPQEYITEKLAAEHFTEEEISKAFEVMAENRQEKLLNLIGKYLEEEPVLSRNALISKLRENSYSQEEIEQGLELINMDWKEQAVKASEEYINTEVIIEDEFYEVTSKKYLRQLLIEEKKFAQAEATYGIEESAIDWEEQAFKQANYYLTMGTYSKNSLMEKLITVEFTQEEAEYGVTETKTNWEEQAMKMAEEYLIHALSHAKEGALSYLQDAGFSKEETDQAINLLFQDTKEEELEVEERSLEILSISEPEKSILIKPLEFVTNQIETSISKSKNMLKAPKGTRSKKLKSPITNNTRSSQRKISKVAETEVGEKMEELDGPSLFDSPVFLPVIMVLAVGNLYLFQKS